MFVWNIAMEYSSVWSEQVAIFLEHCWHSCSSNWTEQYIFVAHSLHLPVPNQNYVVFFVAHSLHLHVPNQNCVALFVARFWHCVVEESARKVVCAPAPVGRGEQHLDWLGDDDDDGDCDQFCVEFLARQHHTSYPYENLALEHYIFRLQQHFVRNFFWDTM